MGGYSVSSDLDLGKKSWKFGFSRIWGVILYLRIWTSEKKLEIWIFKMGAVFCIFRFELRKKSWKFGFSGFGGYSVSSDLDLGKKVGNLDFRIWGGGIL